MKRAQRLIRETFETWQVRALGLHDANPLFLGEAADLDAAVQLGVDRGSHKGVFFVRRTDALSGASVQHFYRIRQSRAIWRPAAYDMAHQVKFRPLYAEHQFDLAVTTQGSN